RAQHISQCIETTALANEEGEKILLYKEGENRIDGEKYYCSLCAKDLCKSNVVNRIKHLKVCAKRHNVSNLDQFRNRKNWVKKAKAIEASPKNKRRKRTTVSKKRTSTRRTHNANRVLQEK